MRRLVVALRLPIALLAAALLPGACGSDSVPDRGPTVSYRAVSYHYDGTPEGLQQVKRLAGFYCEDRYDAAAKLIRTRRVPNGYAEAVYECM